MRSKPNSQAQRLPIQSSTDLYRQILRSYVVETCEPNWPVTKKLLGALRASDWNTVVKTVNQIASSDVTPEGYEPWTGTEVSVPFVHVVRTMAQLVGFVAKYDWSGLLELELTPDQKAWKKFRAREHLNRRLNAVFRGHRARGTFPAGDVILRRMQATIRRVLGDEPDFDLISQSCEFTSGACIGVKGSSVNLAEKLEIGSLTTSKCASSYYPQAVLNNVQLFEYHARQVFPDDRDIFCFDPKGVFAELGSWLRFEEESRILFVPKKFDCSRVIAKGPTINGFLQKGVDIWMRGRLKAVLNLDLTDQAVNQIMANEGSRFGYDPYVTLDLSSASDSITTELCRTLLPSAWFSFLNNLRTTSYKAVDPFSGSVVTRPFELFVNMGNGFAFPLETLIFAAAIVAVHHECGVLCDYRCYGDDVIVRQSLALRVIEVFHDLGFRVNKDKTHIHGPFRESCGANWYDGISVLPIYIRRKLEFIGDVYNLHNTIDSPAVKAVIYDFINQFNGVKHAVPDWSSYSFVTTEALRLPLDIIMTSRSASWSRKDRRWRFSLLRPLPKKASERMLFEGRSRRIDVLRLMQMLHGSHPDDAFAVRGVKGYITVAP